MNTNLENFCPKLRPGRVIPQGSRIIFETDNPYNQIILPMALADLVLLCSGKFSVREIVEKIYKKQGAVPFRSILMAIHVLHQGGFFENGEELTLSSDLRSWMEPRRSRWNLSWRFGQRIVADEKSPTTYYLATLSILIGSILGFQLFPSNPLLMSETWGAALNKWEVVWKLFVASSALMTLKYCIRGWQTILLTGKAYNVALRLSPWGIHLHVGNEANDLFENRLYTVMFYVSQILVPWACLYMASFFTTSAELEPLIVMAMAITFWEMNPFVNSDGMRLIQALLLPNDRDVASWHFESNQLIDSISPEQRQRDQDFGRLCAIWGAIWLLMSFALLHEAAITFGPTVLQNISQFSMNSIIPALGLIAWLAGLYQVVQALVETVAASLIRPHWRRVRHHLKQLQARTHDEWPTTEVVAKIEDLPLFSHFHEQYLVKVIEKSQLLKFDAGSVILREGDPARDLFVLLEGELEVIRMGRNNESEWITELGPVSVFGEAALVDDQPRTAQAVSKTAVIALRVPVQVLRETALESQAIRHLEDFRNAILVNQFFASSQVFRSLSPSSIAFLSSRGTLEYYDKNQLVFLQGDMGDSLYLILRGTVAVTVHQTTLKHLSQGNFFGEISLIANVARTATITTVEPSVLFKISADAFWEVLVRHLDLGVFLETVSENRLREDLEFAPLPKTGTDSE